MGEREDKLVIPQRRADALGQARGAAPGGRLRRAPCRRTDRRRRVRAATSTPTTPRRSSTRSRRGLCPGLIDSHVHPGHRRLHAAPAADPLDRLLPARRRHVDGLRRRGAPARPPEGSRRAQGDGDRLAALVRELPPLRRQGARRCPGARERHGGAGLQGSGRGGRHAPRRGRARHGQGRRHGRADGQVGEKARPAVDDPHRRAVDPGLGADRRGHRARGRRRHHRSHQRRAHGAPGRSDHLPVRRLPARHRDRAQRQRARGASWPCAPPSSSVSPSA